jgi:glutamine synthetase
LSEAEVRARQHTLFEEYCKHIKIESLTMLDIVNREIVPAIISYQSRLTKMALDKKQLKINYSFENKLLLEINKLLIDLKSCKSELINDLSKLRKIDEIQKRAKFYQIYICQDMSRLRSAVDSLERLIPKNIWPMPTYADILFYL